MTDLPAPLTPPDCDLRGYDYMPFLGQRFFQSRLYVKSLRNPRAGLAAFKLWWSAWLECPAGSLPDNDEDLAMLADFGTDMKGWRAVREVALHGFVKCSDGRIYHPTVCEQAIKSYEHRLKSGAKRDADRDRLRNWREARRKHDQDEFQNVEEVRLDTRVEKRADTGVETRVETRFVAGGSDVMLIEEEKLSLSLKNAGDLQFDEFWLAYPRKVGKEAARKAFAKARRSTSTETIMAGLRQARWSPDPQFIPHAATWLHAGRWQDELGVTAPGSRPVPAAGQSSPCPEDPPEAWTGLADSFEKPWKKDTMHPVVSGFFLDVTAQEVANVAGLRWDWRGDWHVLVGWMREGFNPDEQIIPAIKRIAARSGYQPPSTLRYFDQAVRTRT